MLITQAKDIPLSAMTFWQKFDVLVWLMVSELYERKLEELPRQIEAARALPDKHEGLEVA